MKIRDYQKNILKNYTGKLDGRVWIRSFALDGMKEYICCVSKEDNEKYGFNGVEMFGDDTYIVEFNKIEFENFKRTKLIDEMMRD